MKENKAEWADTFWERRYILVKACRSRDLKQVEEPSMKVLGKCTLGGGKQQVQMS